MAISEKKYKALQGRLRGMRERGREMVMTTVEAVETGASASAHAALDGYFLGVDVLGVPLGAITGTAFHLLGALGVAPDHMHALGNGAYACPIVQASQRFGEGLRADAESPAAAVSGRLGRGRASLSDLELRRIAGMAR